METNVAKINERSKVPAGILSGTEAFWFNNEKWIIHNGQTLLFSEAPHAIQQMIADTFLADIKGRDYLREKIGIKAFSASFDMWYKCRIGALDDAPDFIDGNLNADAYNHSCSDMKCPHRGKFCSLAPGLQNYELQTIKALKKGMNEKLTADYLNISVAGLKSRIEKLKEKLNASNMASLIANAAEFGI